MVCVQIDADGSQAAIGQDRGLHHPGGGEHSPATSVRLEPVAYGLSEIGGARRLLSLLTTTVLGIRIGLKRREQLFVPIGEEHVLYNKMLAVLLCQAVRQS